MEYNTTSSTTEIEENESTEVVVEEIDELTTTEQIISNIARSRFESNFTYFVIILFLSVLI